MKKIAFCAPIIAGALILCVSGCGTKSSGPCVGRDADSVAQTDAQAFAVDTIAYDSVSATTAKCNIQVAYPKGSDSLALGIKRFIAGELASLYLPRTYTDDAAQQRAFPLYGGSIDNGAALVGHYGNGVMRFLSALRKEMDDARTEKNELPMLSAQTTISLDTVTPRYITYRITDDSYPGGAHHAYSSYCVNISRQPFKPVEQIISPTHIKALQPLLRANLVRSLKASGVENVTAATLAHYLILPDDGIIPLPAHGAWIQRDSIQMAYQPYEIASYAVGRITFSVAVKDIKPYLTTEALRLLGQ